MPLLTDRLSLSTSRARNIVFVAVTCPRSLKIPGNSLGSRRQRRRWHGIYRSNYRGIARPHMSVAHDTNSDRVRRHHVVSRHFRWETIPFLRFFLSFFYQECISVTTAAAGRATFPTNSSSACSLESVWQILNWLLLMCTINLLWEKYSFKHSEKNSSMQETEILHRKKKSNGWLLHWILCL
jgi:hypothetical protein